MKNEKHFDGQAGVTPMLFPYDPEAFWTTFRNIVREELTRQKKEPAAATTFQTPGLDYKPLYKITEVCALFQVTKPTIYDWVKRGKLKPLKIRSRVFFLWQDIQNLMQVHENAA